MSSVVKRFHNELKAAMIARAPIEIGGEPQNVKLTPEALERWEGLLEPLLARGESLEQAIALAPELPSRYLAAIQVFELTGSMVPVLNGLTARKIATQRSARVLRWTLFYLLLIVVVAFVGLRLFNNRLKPAIESMRLDSFAPSAVSGPETFDILPWVPSIVVGLGALSAILLVWLVIGGVRRTAMWLGGRHYVRCRTSATAIRVFQSLRLHDVSPETALALSCELTGADGPVRGDIRTAIDLPADSADYDTIANYFLIASNQRMASLKFGTPIALVSTFGGAIVVLYGILIYWPVISMLKDLAAFGT